MDSVEGLGHQMWQVFIMRIGKQSVTERCGRCLFDSEVILGTNFTLGGMEELETLEATGLFCTKNGIEMPCVSKHSIITSMDESIVRPRWNMLWYD